MNYRKIYQDLIISRQLLQRKRKDRIRNKTNPNYVYYENHHILPQCLGGTKTKENMVLLTFKEHFIAHLLLTKCYEGEAKDKMGFALHKMCYGSHTNKRNCSASQYAYAKFVQKEALKNKVIWNKGLTKETDERVRKNIESKTKGWTNPPRTKEHCEKISKWLTGRTLSDITKNKKSLVMKKPWSEKRRQAQLNKKNNVH